MKRKMCNRGISMWVFIFLSCLSWSQQPENQSTKAEKKLSQNQTHQANKKLTENNFSDAEYNYKKAIATDKENTTAKYNLGTAYFKDKKYEESYYTLSKALETAKTKEEKHKVYHNMGNAFMAKKDYANAMKAYQSAIINDPSDKKTLYNYALAKKLLEKQPPKNEKDDKKDKKDDKKDKKDDKEDKKDDKKDKKDDKKDKKDDKKDKKDDKKDKRPPKLKKGQLQPQQIRNILDAVDKEEEKVQKKINAQKVKGKPLRQEKDW